MTAPLSRCPEGSPAPCLELFAFAMEKLHIYMANSCIQICQLGGAPLSEDPIAYSLGISMDKLYFTVELQKEIAQS